MTDKEVVVTGATGFVARYVLKTLSTYRTKTTGLTKGYRKGFKPTPDINFINVHEYSEYLPQEEATLIHLGEPSHVSTIDERGYCHVDDMCRQAQSLVSLPYKKLVFASSATVYGDSSDTRHRPSDDVVTGLKIYADAKIEVEKIFNAHTGTIARLTNVYGIGMSEINIFSDILSQLSSLGPITIREKSPVREYLWVEDAARCLVQMATENCHGVYNLSSGQPISCEGLAQLILKLSNQPERKIQALFQDRESCLKLDINKTIQKFHWKPEVTLEEGITRLLSIYKH